jgi:hypothetical protein
VAPPRVDGATRWSSVSGGVGGSTIRPESGEQTVRSPHRRSSNFLERNELGDILSRLTGDFMEELILSGVAQELISAFKH